MDLVCHSAFSVCRCLSVSGQAYLWASRFVLLSFYRGFGFLGFLVAIPSVVVFSLEFSSRFPICEIDMCISLYPRLLKFQMNSDALCICSVLICLEYDDP